MVFAERALEFIGWIRNHRVLVSLIIILFEGLIGLLDYAIVTSEIPIAELHFITITLTAIIYGLPGVIAISLSATTSYYISNYVGTGKPLAQIAIPAVGLTFLIFLVVSASVLFILKLLDSLNLSNLALTDKVAQLQTTRARIELLTTERERSRMARELHDGVAKTLIGVEYSAAALGQVLPFDNYLAHEKARFIQEVCHNEGQKLREVILDLRQGYQEPIFQLISNYLARWQVAYSVQTHFDNKGSDVGLDPNLVYELMAIFEEALENVQRHSQATQVWISLEVQPQKQIELQISDNGLGLPKHVLEHFQANNTPNLQLQLRGPDGRLQFGLTGMIERAEWLGGKLDLAATQAGGLTITVHIPLENSVRLKIPISEQLNLK